MSGWLLVTAYLAAGSAEPFVQHRLYDDKQDCRAVAEKYVQQVRVGQSRAFCLKVKGSAWKNK